MRILLFVALALIGNISFAQKKKSFSPFIKNLPQPARVVNDFGKFLTTAEGDYLENELVSYRQQAGYSIVIITLNSLTDANTGTEYTVEETALQYFNKWGIGDKTKNDGILLLVSRNPRRVRIQTGIGVSQDLTDWKCQSIINSKIVPAFKSGLFFTGLKDGISEIQQGLEDAVKRKKAEATKASLESITPTSTTSTPAQQAYATESKPPTFWGLIQGLFALTFVVWLYAKYRKWRGSSSGGGWFSRSGYSGGNNVYIRNSNTNRSFFSGWSSGGGSSSRSYSTRSSSSGSSSSGSSSSDSYGGGSSGGGGASGSW
jgi:uncharacterized protein